LHLSSLRHLPIALVLVSPLSLSLAALAVPIQSAHGVTAPVASSVSGGPKRPGSIPASSSSGSSSTADISNQRGRPVPGISATQSNGRTLAEIKPDNPMPVQ
jgi:hypothetical protein